MDLSFELRCHEPGKDTAYTCLPHLLEAASVSKEGVICRLPAIWALNLSNLVLVQAAPKGIRARHLPALMQTWPDKYLWQLPFCFGVLRMLSYSLDLHNARLRSQELQTGDGQMKVKPKSARVRPHLQNHQKF